MPDINAPLTDAQLAHYREAKRLIESPTLTEVFATLKAAYLNEWEMSDTASAGVPADPTHAALKRGTLWVKVKCLQDLQFELGAYASRADVAESAGPR